MVGLFFGMVPGLGGKIAISLCIPFVLTLEPLTGVVFLVAMHAVVHTGGSVPSILLGVPGTGADAATCVDGHPLALKGEAGRALGASLFASAVGGVIGATFLLGMLPILEPVILALSPAEYFLLAMLGITFVSAASGQSLRKGIILGCFGIGISFIGLSPHSGEPRYVFGQLFLWDGVNFLTAVLALLAVPEMVALAMWDERVPESEQQAQPYRRAEMMRGFRDIVVHRWLVLRTSIIGTVIGAIPGLGGDAASWICYGHAVQSSTTPERFGQGAIEGVIAPETANNSKEGGALLPTLFFGIPGSSGMAVMLGAFVALGVQPGPNILTHEKELFAGMVGALVMANLVAVAVLLVIAPYVMKVVRFSGRLLAPLVFVMVTVGCYVSALDWQHLVVLVALGVLGCGLKRFAWPRAPFVIGLALGPIAEVSFIQAMQISGPAFFLRPVSVALEVLIAATVFHYWWRHKRRGAAS
jgi:TctA family transporter